MSQYTNVKEGQKKKLQTGGPVSIRFIYEDLTGYDILALTKSQLNKLA